jgi:hypothetical protein
MEKQQEVNIQNLLNQVNLISKHYNRISYLTGENFNIFSIMSMEKNEVYTHSAIILELLNPNGNHGQDDVFLKAFIDIVNSNIEREKNLNNKIPYLNNCEGLKEHTIKEFLEIKPSGGRIDIYITNKKQSIIIENKIDADSQPDQLLRYYNYAIKKYKDEFWLIYLQKTENNHTEDDLKYSCGINDNHHNSIETKAKIIKITYENEILQWLKECLKHTSNLPIIRETINQYIHLVNKITNQSNNNLMSEDLIKLIVSSKENIESTLEIQKLNIGKALVDIFCKNLETEAEKIGLKFTKFGTLMSIDDCFIFHKENWNYAITFLFEDINMSNLCVGISMKQNGLTHNPNDEFSQRIRERLEYTNMNDTWCGWEELDGMLHNIPWQDFKEIPVNLVMNKVKDIYNKVGDILE